MPLPVLADVCLMTTFSHHHVRSIVGHELLVCLQHSCQPFATLSTMATTARLQQAARAVPVAADPNEVHQHVFNLLRATREVLDTTIKWNREKVDDDMFIEKRPYAAKSLAALR